MELGEGSHLLRGGKVTRNQTITTGNYILHSITGGDDFFGITDLELH
jgi:hypothetical protein